MSSLVSILAGQKPGYFRDEIRPKLKFNKKGTVAMANLGPDLNDSRFFITLADDLHQLDGKHTIFGQVAEGEEVLDKINSAFADDDGRPYKDIRFGAFGAHLVSPAELCSRTFFFRLYICGPSEFATR